MRTVVVVEWLDPTDRDDGWVGKDEAKRLSAATRVRTYGELLEEDEKFLKLAYNVCEDGSYNGTGVITKATIVKRRDYKDPWRPKAKKPPKHKTDGEEEE
jgi:hypothetical protein